MQGLTLLVGQIVTVIVDDQFQLGAFRELGRLVQVQASVLHTRAQRGHGVTLRPAAAGGKVAPGPVQTHTKRHREVRRQVDSRIV